MRQDGSFEARAAHNKSHHRPYGGQSIEDGERVRESTRGTHVEASRRFPRRGCAGWTGTEVA